MREHRISSVAVAVVIGSATQAHAAVTISSAPTQNMSCSNGVCSPTADKAVLNAGDLETLLASGSVEVTTTGSGVQAKDIVVKVALTWSASNALTLDAYQSITINKPVSVAGLSALALTANDGGNNGILSFGPKGNVTFANLSSSLAINGAAYTLVNTVQSLASAIANNPSGNYAFATSYDAKLDGTYSNIPISTNFSGIFEGLGNQISQLKVDTRGNGGAGFFDWLNPGSEVNDLGLRNIKVVGQGGAGGLALANYGTVARCHVSGTVKAGAFVGGLIAINGAYADAAGTVSASYATGTVTGTGSKSTVGGLVGFNEYGTISDSFADAAAVGLRGGSVREFTEVGGLVGGNQGSILRSYATGSATSLGSYAVAGGLVGGNYGAAGTISQVYSTGAVGAESFEGGLIGYDQAASGSISYAYWDTDTSGIANLSQGAGNVVNDPGITGLTTAQLQSGLPQGFDPKAWGEKPNINGGLPYLIGNPPPK